MQLAVGFCTRPNGDFFSSFDQVKTLFMSSLVKTKRCCSNRGGGAGRQTSGNGPPGRTGARGATGATGAIGDIGTAIMPFASGNAPLTLFSVTALPLVAIVGVIGPSNSFSGNFFPISPTVMDLTASGTLQSVAFIASKDINVTQIDAFFTVTTALNLPTTQATILAQLWISTTPNNIFTPIGPVVTIGTLSGATVPFGTVINGSSGPVSFTIPASSRVQMVYSVSVEGEPLAIGVSGAASGDISYSM